MARLKTINVGVLEVIDKTSALLDSRLDTKDQECRALLKWSVEGVSIGVHIQAYTTGKPYGLMAPLIWLSSLCDRGGRKEMTAI